MDLIVFVFLTWLYVQTRYRWNSLYLNFHQNGQVVESKLYPF